MRIVSRGLLSAISLPPRTRFSNVSRMGRIGSSIASGGPARPSRWRPGFRSELFQIVIDHARNRRHCNSGSPRPHLAAAARSLHRVFAARTQPLLQNLPGGRQDKDRNRLRNLTLQLSRTLHVDVEYQVLPCGSRLYPERSGGSRSSCRRRSAYSRNSPRAMRALEVLRGDKMIVFAFLALRRGACGSCRRPKT